MKKYIIWILILSAATHFIFFGQPKETIFDEVHFGKFISGYFTHEYFFDIHPPLGKLLIAGAAKLSGFKPGFSFQNIGQEFQDNQYKALRFLPSLFGTLLPLVIFLILNQILNSDGRRARHRLWLSQRRAGIRIAEPKHIRSYVLGEARYSRAALLGSLFLVFENGLIVQSRSILLDSMLLFFGFTALLFFLKRNLLLAGVFGVLAASIKWTGLSFLGLFLLWQLVEFFKPRSEISENLINNSAMKSQSEILLRGKFILKNALFLIVIPALIYFSIFAIHFSLLNKSGPGDGFHSPAFLKTLIGSRYYNKPIKGKNILEKFIELNKELYTSNKNLTATHPYSSKWYTWPLMTRPIFYWSSQCRDCFPGVEPDLAPFGTMSQKTISMERQHRDWDAKIYLLGNPVVWWLSTGAVLYLLYRVIQREKANKTEVFLIAGYLINLLPFIKIGRVMFLYHYLPALVFSIIILAFIIHNANTRIYANNTNNNKRFALFATNSYISVILILVITAFAFFSPLTYGLQIPKSYYEAMVWFPSWR